MSLTVETTVFFGLINYAKIAFGVKKLQFPWSNVNAQRLSVYCENIAAIYFGWVTTRTVQDKFEIAEKSDF